MSLIYVKLLRCISYTNPILNMLNTKVVKLILFKSVLKGLRLKIQFGGKNSNLQPQIRMDFEDKINFILIY